jgi:hypothetical protein
MTNAHLKAPLILNEQHVRTMAEHLPHLCEAKCNDGHCSCKGGDFRMNTTGSYRVARMYLGKQFIECKLHELRYLSYIFFMVRNQLTFYLAALDDVLAYVNSAQSSTTYVEPPATAHKSINYFICLKNSRQYCNTFYYYYYYYYFQHAPLHLVILHAWLYRYNQCKVVSFSLTVHLGHGC